MIIFLGATACVRQVDIYTSYCPNLAQIVPDASVGTIIHTCGATTLITLPPAHSEGLSPLKLHKARSAAVRGQRSPDRVCFSGHVYVSLDMCMFLWTCV